MQETNEVLSLYSNLTYMCIGLATVSFIATVFFFFRFQIWQNIRKRSAMKKLTNANRKRGATSEQLARSQRVARMEYQTTSDLRGKRTGQLGRQRGRILAAEPVPVTDLLRKPETVGFRVVREEMIIHTEEFI